MLFAAWGSDGLHNYPSWSRIVRSIVLAPGRSRCEHHPGVVAASSPARLESRGDGAVAWQYSGHARDGIASAVGIHVELTPDELRLTCGILPQYPLYYYRAPRDAFFAVCSELAPLKGFLKSPELNLEHLAELAAWRPGGDLGATPFRGLRRVAPCETLRVGTDGIRSSVTVPTAGTSYRQAAARDLASELRFRLERAVETAIGGAERVAVLAGGGLDSSGVLAMALAHCRGARKRELLLLSEVWASPGEDGPYLDTLERALGIKAVRLPARQAGPWFRTSLCTDAQPQPFGSACLEMLLWDAARERGAEVTLAGYAGDEICGGIVSFAPLVLRGQPLRAIVDALRLAVPGSPSATDRLGSWVVSPLVKPLLPRTVLSFLRRHRSRAAWMTPRFADLLRPTIEREPRRLPRTPDEWMSYHCTSGFLSELSVLFGQSLSVTGTPVVDVFRDVDLVRFIAQVDPLQLSTGHMFRGLYRKAMVGVVPEAIRLRRSKALGHPAIAGAALSAHVMPLLRDLSSLEMLASADLVDPARFRALADPWLRLLQRGERLDLDPADESWHVVWQLLSVEAFLRAEAAPPPSHEGPSVDRPHVPPVPSVVS